MFNEREYFKELQEKNIEGFLRKIKVLDDKLRQEMQLTGWKYIKTAEKTVTFTFGVVRYKRRVYVKNGVYRYPIDEELGIVKSGRYSPELLYQVADYTTSMSIRQVSEKFEVSSQLYIGKSTVHKTIKKVAKLFDEREDYRYWEEHEVIKRIKSPAIYVEGDGVMVKAQDKENGIDMAHFLVHTGSTCISKTRWKLENKMEIISTSYVIAKEQLEDLLTNYYDITNETLLITNSDMGKGYTPYIFKSLAKLFKCKHEHFWDAKHLNMKIKEEFKLLSHELQNLLFEAIQTHNYHQTLVVLDTAESQIVNSGDKEWEKFIKFKKNLIQNFQYTKPAVLRGFTNRGIGVMETQHRKITYRMKKRGMYWSERGANTMSKMILAAYDNSLRDLFFGSWKQQYTYYQSIDIPVSEFLLKEKTSAIRDLNHTVGRSIRLGNKGNF
ncbi:ISLre2 family transposase [Lactococcus petauri]|uniref:ISLre2 family transposase n=1 Tax=Lactococcus petauri TaxID=1940789 RepID=UPI003852AEEA